MRRRARLCAAVLLCAAPPAIAQELEARAYAPNPVGVRFAALSATHSEGDMLLHSSSPIRDFKVRANTWVAGLGGTFAIGDRVASFGVVVPLVEGTATGEVNGLPRRADRTGAGDLRARLTVSLLPDSAQDAATFARQPPDRTLAASLVVIAPTGEYFEDKLVNIGANRWAVKPELGGSQRFGRWYLDGSVGLWLFEDNDDYFGGRERSQDPIGTLQVNLSCTFAPRLWLGAGATWYAGGGTTVDGVPDRNRQDNSRAGVTLALPIGTRNSIKLAWSTGVTARYGGDLDVISVSWQYLWFR